MKYQQGTIKILALDLGTKTGWAIGEKGDGSSFYHGVQDFSLKRGESPGMRFLRFDKWIETMLSEHAVTFVIYEMPHHRGGHATAVLGGLVSILQKTCAQCEVDFTQVHSSTLKRFATGSGRASKEDMVDQVFKSYKIKVFDDNEADAIHMWHYADEVEV